MSFPIFFGGENGQKHQVEVEKVLRIEEVGSDRFKMVFINNTSLEITKAERDAYNKEKELRELAQAQKKSPPKPYGVTVPGPGFGTDLYPRR